MRPAWREVLQVMVYGAPKGQPRGRAFVTKGGQPRVFNPSTAEGWKSSIAEALQGHLPATPIDGPVSVTVSYQMPRPKRLMRKRDSEGPLAHTSKPDVDNLNKAIFDTLTRLGVFRDDSQICHVEAGKHYHGKDDLPGALIVVKTLLQEERASAIT